jgi:hypothetical protein
MQTSMSNESMVFPYDIEQPKYQNNNKKWMVFPKDLNLNRGYSFFVKVVADGGSSKFFGPYSLQVGCSYQSTNVTDNGDFITYLPVAVDSNKEDVYAFSPPVT